MQSPNHSEEFYSKLKAQLYETTSWPSKYLFKFIVKSDPDKITKIESNFDNMGAIITSSVSKNGKYTSVSIHVGMTNPEAVIEKYMLIGKEVKDVISL
jgi:putative lipoic acid-binding regulatory protein